MRLAGIRNFRFANLNFYHYFFTAYIGLHITFSLLLGKITAFAPDENTYREIFNSLYKADFNSSINGFGDQWEIWLRLPYLPAKLLTYIGVSDLLAIRFLAIGYSTMATAFLVKLALLNNRDSRVFRVALISISFIPTVFLWSSIGLRESFLYVEISAILYFLSKIKEKIEVRNFIGLGIAVFSLSMTKNYIFILFLFAFIITITIFTFTKRKNLFAHLLILVIALIPLAVNTSLIADISAYSKGQLTKPQMSFAEDINNDGKCNKFELCDKEIQRNNTYKTGGITLHSLSLELLSKPDSVIARTLKKLGITEILEEISREKTYSQINDEVIQNTEKLSLRQAGLRHPDQLINSSLKFLLVPFIFIDNGSLFLNIQSLETPIWLFIYGLFFVGLYQIIRSRRELDYAVMVATLFALEFVAISALTEINVGTALRHRSLLLIPILVIWLSREKRSLPL